MSAHRWTDWRIACDWPGCTLDVFASNLDLRDNTPAGARKILKRAGWKVGIPPRRVPAAEGAGRNLDFCPEHALLVQ